MEVTENLDSFSFQCTAEFVCNEAMAIPLEQKCDGTNDCPTTRWTELVHGGKAKDEELFMCRPEGK